jgi:hypothetical protein
MYYLQDRQDGPYDPAASPLFGAQAGYGIPAHDLAGARDVNALDAWAKPPVNTSDVCYCGYRAEPHGVGREHHGTNYVPTPEGTAQAAYDRFANGTNVVPQ